MTRRAYIVVHGVASACGLHPGSKSWRECPHCARAHAANEAALANVVPRKHREVQAVTPERRRQHQQYMPVPGQSARSMATIPTQRART